MVTAAGQQQRRMRVWLRVAIAVAAIIALLVGLVWFFQRRLIYFPDTAAVPPAGEMLTGGQDVTLQTEDGLELQAWYVPAPLPSVSSDISGSSQPSVSTGSSGPESSGQGTTGPGSTGEITSSRCRPTVLVANGNAGNRLSRTPLAQSLVDAGFGVLLVDYRGYGGNPGSPTEDGLAADLRAAHQFLTMDQGIGANELVYFGESLGAAVVTRLAVDYPPAGLILRSPFTELADVAQQLYPFVPVRLLLRDRFPVLETIAQVQVPTTVVYGSADSLVPPQQSLAVAAASGGLTTTVDVQDADHNDRALGAGPAVIAAVVELANRAGCPPAR